jgi:hypothetical protein
MKLFKTAEVWHYIFLTSARDYCEWSVSGHGLVTSSEDTHTTEYILGGVESIIGQDALEQKQVLVPARILIPKTWKS